MRYLTAKELKNRTGTALGMVAEGEILYITKRGRPVARIEAVKEAPRRARPSTRLAAAIKRLRGKHTNLPPAAAISRLRRAEDERRRWK